MLSIFILVLTLFQQPQQIGGRVVDIDGQPIKGVRISGREIYPDGITQTNEIGRFSLSLAAPKLDWPTTVRFWHEGYRPTTKVMTELPSELNVTLEKTDDPPLTITKCRKKTQFGGGPFMAFLLPKKMKIHRGSDIDFFTQSIEFKKHWMQFGVGLSWSWGMPPASTLQNLTKVRERDMVFEPEVIGVEYRGVRPDGTYFRFIGKIAETVEYDNATKEAAMFFDGILDTLCKP